MSKPIVSRIACATYDENAVQAAIKQAITDILPGGLADLVKPGFTDRKSTRLNSSHH